MKGMSKRQQEIYNFIEAYNNERKISPSISDIADGIGLANSTIVAHITALKQKGFLVSDYCVPRSFRIVQPKGDLSSTVI